MSIAIRVERRLGEDVPLLGTPMFETGQCVSGSVSAASLWSELRGGSKVVTDFDYRDGYCHVTFETRVPGERPPKQCFDALEAAFLGHPLKHFADECQASVSTVSVMIRDALRAMGLSDGGVASAPMLFAMAAHAHRGVVALPLLARLSVLGRELVSARRPDDCLVARLPPAEGQVASMRLEGLSGEAIGIRRGTSARTVANQHNAISRRFNVPGRAEHLSCAIRTSASEGQRELEDRAPSSSRRALGSELSLGN